MIFNGQKYKRSYVKYATKVWIFIFFYKMFSKCPPKLLSLHSSALLFVYRTIFRISTSLISAEVDPRSSWAQLDVLGSHLNICDITWDENEKYRDNKRREYGGQWRIFTCEIIISSNLAWRKSRYSICRCVAAGTILLEPILTSCCQILHWLPDIFLEDSLQIYFRTYWSLEPNVREDSSILNPHPGHHFLAMSLLHSITEWGFEGAQYRKICLFSHCFKEKHFSSNNMVLFEHSSSKFKQKVQTSYLDSMLARLRQCVKCGLCALLSRLFLSFFF